MKMNNNRLGQKGTFSIITDWKLPKIRGDGFKIARSHKIQVEVTQGRLNPVFYINKSIFAMQFTLTEGSEQVEKSLTQFAFTDGYKNSE